MTREEHIKKVFDFIHAHGLATISTIDARGQKPESALVAFAENQQLELVFGTHKNARKYENLKHNPNVAFVIGWDPKVHITVQYEGEARELQGEELVKWQKIFKDKKTPYTDEFLFNPEMRLFTVEPKWVAYADSTKKPYEVFETFFPGSSDKL